MWYIVHLINISVLTTMRCCPLTSAATALIMATILHIMTPASTIKSGIRVWTAQSRGGERCRSPSWKMVTIPFLEGVLLNPVMAQARKIWGLNHLRHKKNIKLTSTFFGKSCCWYPNLYLSVSQSEEREGHLYSHSCSSISWCFSTDVNHIWTAPCS